MTFKYESIEIEEEDGYYKNIVVMHEAIDTTIVKVSW